MAYLPIKKGTILIPSGTTHAPDKKHLFVICTDPCTINHQLLVPICTYTNLLCDNTCLVQPYEHPFLDDVSYVLYRKSRIEEVNVLVSGVNAGKLVPKAEMNGQSVIAQGGVLKAGRLAFDAGLGS